MDRKQSRTRVSGLWLACLSLLLLMVACGQAPAPFPSSPRTEEAPRSAERNPARTADHYDLERDEQRGGHTLEKHVGKSDEELRERLRRERKIAAASSWADRDTAEGTIAEALGVEQRRIDTWLGRGYPRPNLALHYNAGHTIGRSLRRGDEQTEDCTNAVIVLRADGPGSFYVLTSYPEARE